MDTLNLVGCILVVIMAFAFAFANGYNEPNVAAVVISTKAISPRKALLAVGVLEFIGACVLGTAVARTFATGIVDPGIISQGHYGMVTILMTLVGATGWTIICTFLGFPISASMALVGGLVGAGIGAAGFGVISWRTVIIIFGLLITSPFLGFFFSFIVTKFSYLSVRRARPSIKHVIVFLEVIATAGVALVTGANNAQRPMGIIVFALITAGLIESTASYYTPAWVIVSCGIALALGIISTGRNVLKTVGRGYYRIRHINGFSAQLASTGIIQAANVIGMPVSTSQVTSSSVLGTGAAEGIKAVRWGTSFRVLSVWFITMPAVAVLTYLLYLLAVNGLKLIGV